MSARAAVDVGSNSVRLLVVDDAGRSLTRRMEITRLAANVDERGHLDDGALERTLEAIEGFARIWREHGAGERVRITATSAVRDASDRDRFVDAVTQRTGVRPEVLTGEQEAQLAFAGALGAVDVERPAAVVDVGGGSTEIILGDGHDRVVAATSLQLGCVRLAERHLRHDPALPAELDAARDDVRQTLASARSMLSDHLAGARHSLVAVAGTATTLGALHLGLEVYDAERIHGCVLPAERLSALAVELAAMTSDDRARLGPMQPGREDVIHAGALVLDGVARLIGVDEVVVSEADGLDGLVATLEVER